MREAASSPVGVGGDDFVADLIDCCFGRWYPLSACQKVCLAAAPLQLQHQHVFVRIIAMHRGCGCKVPRNYLVGAVGTRVAFQRLNGVVPLMCFPRFAERAEFANWLSCCNVTRSDVQQQHTQLRPRTTW